MLSIPGRATRLCDGISRREVLRVGGLAFSGLSLADLLRLRAAVGTEANAGRGKSVIMIWLRGGASHIDSYGKYCESMLVARRLVEAGVPVVTLKVGDRDTHEHNFRDMREQLPQLDQGFHALVADLYERGLDKDVAVVMWGEFGRAPQITRIAGRDHWPDAGAAVMAGGGFEAGQTIGETDAHAARSMVTPYFDCLRFVVY